MAKNSPKSSGAANKRKWLLGGLLTLFALGGGWLWYDRRKFNQALRSGPYEPPGAVPGLPATLVQATTASSGGGSKYRPDSSYPLSMYMKGRKVRLIQLALNDRFKAGLKVDGYWGPKTEAALQRFKLPTVISEANFKKLTLLYGKSSEIQPG